ncbi:MAG: AAA family ATPase [Acidihalobacter sp.]
MLNKELEFTLNMAFKQAREKRHEFMTVEHLLLALTDNPTAAAVLRACGADLLTLKRELEQFIADNTPLLAGGDERETQPTLGFQRVLQRAVFHVQSSGRKEVSGANVLVSLFGEQDSHAVYLLAQQDITRLDVVNYISHGISRVGEEPQEQEGEAAPESAPGGEDSPRSNPLEQFATNLNEHARQGRTDAVVYALDLGALVAGTKYRGDFEKRLKGVLAQLKREPGSVLFIDEIHTLIGAGAASGGVMDASNLIKPMLANGELKCIGSTTYQEYRGIFEKDRALARRFQKIDVREPTVDETFRILKGLKGRFEEHHEVRYTNPALHAAAELSDRYITDRHLPDKAIDVIDEAGARRRMQPPAQRRKTISVRDVEDIIAKIARIPPKQVSSSDLETLKNLARDLKLVVFGQDEAIDTLAAAIKMARSGLGSRENPIGSFLFAGPTGVGKTEVSRQLSLQLGIELVRFDMSEYMERHTVSRLIGAPPGYVGFDQGGLLTDAILKHPHAVLLLDEVEKAHPDVFNLLLQVMDHGTLTDTNGRQVDFRNVILIMTTNAGAQSVSRRSMGFTEQDHASDGMQELRRIFTPEFRNRLDAIIQFKSLDPRTVTNVVDKFLIELEAQLEEKRVHLLVDDEARAWLAERGYDPLMGARPMARVIQEHLKKPLAEEVLFGSLTGGGEVHVAVEDGELKLEFADTAVS